MAQDLILSTVRRKKKRIYLKSLQGRINENKPSRNSFRPFMSLGFSFFPEKISKQLLPHIIIPGLKDLLFLNNHRLFPFKSFSSK